MGETMRKGKGLEKEERDIGYEQDGPPIGNESEIVEVHDRSDEEHYACAQQSEHRTAAPVPGSAQEDVHGIGDAKEHHAEKADEETREDECGHQEHQYAIGNTKPDQGLGDKTDDIVGIKFAGVGTEEGHGKGKRNV